MLMLIKLCMKIFEVSAKNGMREIDYIRYRLDLGTDTYATGKLGYEKIEEDSKLVVEVPEGTRLIWIEGQGYILPDFEVKTTKEVIEDMNCIKEF